MSNQQYRGAQIPDHRSDWLSGRPPAPVWTSALSCPSSGNARLLPVYAGALSATASKLAYRKAKAGEVSYAKGTRWETLTGAAYVDQDTLSAGGANITAAGNATHLGLPCNYMTWPAAAHDWASSYCGDSHGLTVAIGQATGARLDVAVSRALVGDESVTIRITGSSGSASVELNSEFPGPGQFVGVALTNAVAHTVAGSIALYVNLDGSFSSPITVYIRRRMLFDATGLDASECVPDFVDPAVVYNAVAAGVKWVPTKCGNTVAANGVIIPGTGAALPEPMGVQWQPAATNLATYSPPVDTMPSVTYLASTDAPAAVAGLPAKRMTASTANNYLHAIAVALGSPFTGRATTSIVFKKNASARPHLFMNNDSWYSYCHPNSDYSDVYLSSTAHGETASIKALGNDCYIMSISANFAGEANPYCYFRLATSADVEAYIASGEYLDIAALNAVAQAYAGTPMLASGGATSRLADDPATGLPAIGTGAFTAFVDVTVDTLPSEIYPKLFSSNGTSNVGVDMYFLPSGAVWFYKDGSTAVTGTCSLVADTRARLVFRRDSSGVVSLFKDGALETSVASTAHNSTNSPVFGSGVTGEQCDMLFHDYWLDYSALSDEDCIRVTRL